MKTCANSLDVTKSQTFNKDLELLSRLRKIWLWIVQVVVGNNELKLWQTQDSDGHQWWHMYDRATGRYSTASSDAELRELIEQRYSRR